MNATRLMKALESHLKPQIVAEKGYCTVAAEVLEGIETLGKHGPDRWGVALVWDGYSGPPDGDAPDWQTNDITLLVRVPIGLPVTPGDSLHRGIGSDGYSVLEQVEYVSLLMRRMVLSAPGIEPRRMRLIKSHWARLEGQTQTLRIHELRFEIVTELDQAAATVTVPVPL